MRFFPLLLALSNAYAGAFYGGSGGGGGGGGEAVTADTYTNCAATTSGYCKTGPYEFIDGTAYHSRLAGAAGPPAAKSWTDDTNGTGAVTANADGTRTISTTGTTDFAGTTFAPGNANFRCVLSVDWGGIGSANATQLIYYIEDSGGEAYVWLINGSNASYIQDRPAGFEDGTGATTYVNNIVSPSDGPATGFVAFEYDGTNVQVEHSAGGVTYTVVHGPITNPLAAAPSRCGVGAYQSTSTQNFTNATILEASDTAL